MILKSFNDFYAKIANNDPIEQKVIFDERQSIVRSQIAQTGVVSIRHYIEAEPHYNGVRLTAVRKPGALNGYFQSDRASVPGFGKR